MKTKLICFGISALLLLTGCSEFFIPTPLGTVTIQEGSGNGPGDSPLQYGGGSYSPIHPAPSYK